MTQQSKRTITVAATAFALAAAMGMAEAGSESAPASSGITVNGVGTVRARPTVVEVTGTVAGEAELAADARVKYRDNKKKALAAFDGLKIADLTVESVGSEVVETTDAAAAQRMANGMGGDAGKSKVRVTDRLRITLKGADKLDPEKLMDAVLRVVDAARDAGLEVAAPLSSNGNYYEMQARAQAGTPVVVFKIPDTSALRDEAYKRAVADAKSRAGKLAELTDVKLGTVRSVIDNGSGGTGQQSSGSDSSASVVYTVTPGVNAAPVEGVASGTFAEVAVSVKVQVQFEIAK